MEKIIIAERAAEALSKKELLARGFREATDGTMRKEYPSGVPFGLEAGGVILDELPAAPGYYMAGRGFLSLYYYKSSWDPKEFSARVTRAVEEYREDMEALGILGKGKAE